MKALITGGAGFIGSHLCETLLDQGHQVTAIDDLSTGSHSNIAHLESNKNFQLVVDTVLNDQLVNQLVRESEIVFHLASAVGVQLIIDQPTQTIQTIVEGTRVILDAAKRYRRPVLITSTSEVYGDPEVHPQHESYWGNTNPIGLRACYDEGKRCAETLFFDYWRQHGLRIKVARIFNTYGPRMHPNDGRVVSNFIVQALRGEDITIYGDGSQTRSFCYVDDLVEAFVRSMDTDDDFTGPVNIGNPGEFTILELAEKVIAAIGNDSKIVQKNTIKPAW